jgi:hypothetical protein
MTWLLQQMKELLTSENQSSVMEHHAVRVCDRQSSKMVRLSSARPHGITSQKVSTVHICLCENLRSL